MRMSQRFALTTAAALAGVGIALMGIAHTPAGRPLLDLLAHSGLVHLAGGRTDGCPFGFDRQASADDRDRTIRAFAQAHAGSVRASARPAGGFRLETSTRPELLEWARNNRVDCHPKSAGDDLECRAIPVGLLAQAGAASSGTVEMAWLSFDGSQRLAKVVMVQHLPDARSAWAMLSKLTSDLARQAGHAPQASGESSAAGLAAGLLRQTSAELRCRDYYVLARATNFGSSFLLTQEYRALPT